MVHNTTARMHDFLVLSRMKLLSGIVVWYSSRDKWNDTTRY